jgi:SET domain-containing protein
MASLRNTNGKKFEIRSSRIQGRGAFALHRIRKGTRIIEYTGERIGTEEENNRYDDSKMARHHTFLFEVDKHTSIDAARGGNEARYINHSCDPNCEAVNEDGHIFIEAIRNIQPGIELTYDYGFEHDGKITPELMEQYPCRCGSKNCRKTILKLKSPGRRKRTS